MRKEIIIILALIIIAGCSVKRKGSPSARGSDFKSSGMLNVSDVTELNFTTQSFFISRADVNISGDGISQSVNATIKFAKPDSFLISLRAFAGIEVARIFLTSDTILMNDRFNSTLYFGSNQNVKKRFGFDLMFFPVLLGDLITGRQALPVINCNEGNAVLREFRREYIINYFIDCQTKKCTEVKVENELMSDYISIEFDNFGKENKFVFPRHLKINNFANFASCEIAIRRIEFNEGSRIEFIPGRNYNMVEIK